MSEYEAIQEFGFGEGDEDLASDDREKFRPEEGKTYRISLAWWREKKDGEGRIVFDLNKDPRFLRAKVIYKEGVGYVLAKTPEYARITGEDPEDRIATVVVSWPVFRKGGQAGATDKVQFKAGRYEVLPWIFSKHKYQQIMRANNTRAVSKADLRVSCTNGQYQHLEMASYDSNYLREYMEKTPSQFEGLLEKIRSVAKRLPGMLGNDYTLDRLREKMGDEGEPVVEEIVGASEEDFDSLLDGI